MLRRWGHQSVNVGANAISCQSMNSVRLALRSLRDSQLVPLVLHFKDLNHYCLPLLCIQNVAVSLGTGDADYAKMKQILEDVPEVEYICVDVANGYSEHFVQFLRDVRKDFPKHTIIVSLFEAG